MHVVAQRIELRIRDAHSLKEKRHIVKSVSAYLATTFGVAVAEVADHDKWQKATLGVAAVSGQLGQVERVLHALGRHLDARPDVEVLRTATSHLEEAV